jgi:hypothetical protein
MVWGREILKGQSSNEVKPKVISLRYLKLS